MGVPVVTLAGNEHAGRVGVSLLQQIGLETFIARQELDYVAIAVSMAKNPQRLAALRQNLRSSMAASRLCDGDAFACNVEDAYRTLWNKLCNGSGRIT